MQNAKKLTQEEHIVFADMLAKRALQLYDLSPSSYIRLLNYSENTTFAVVDPERKTRTVLRINRPGYHTKEELEAELMWLESIMINSPIIVPKPIAGKNKKFVQTLKNDRYSYPLHCVMFSFLQGSAPDDKDEKNLIFQFERLGEVTALLHEQVNNWEYSRSICRATWDYDTMLGNRPRWGRWQDRYDVTSGLAQLFQRASDTISLRLGRFGKSPERFGLIHADLRLANLLVEEKKIKVIDFDDCGFGWFLYDLGAAVSFIEHKEYVPDLVASWLQGYRKVRSLSKEEESEIPTFIMLRRLLLLAWLGTRHDSDTAKEFGTEFTEKTAELAEKYLLTFA
ncbi:hypothetical protein AM501_27665 [Aneurinibacillus migulanus]|uniref:phosphotransferase enzyme family protein n=1 Tax=Aneurinibacillus migulanus TaxID=47500 RepID=UPI0005B8ED33|nr:phosphotransferase [Aneurinibacillus migulanus]KIV53303.1 hypothetical protein TS64_20245 [Aneurinibacillus migulanus]KPD05131.1 hypothetical protein AM501_27665 [Aneurinibacillus migulanus]MCP1356368.1 phosphotransferase [Aneurinibacillus migulanus]CEH30848.1 Homoserine kinase [Aneurinibacillus migulanus]